MGRRILSTLTNRSAITKLQAAVVVIIIVIAAIAGAWYFAMPKRKGPVTLVFTSPEWLPGSLTGEIAKGFTEWSQKRLGYPVTVKMDLNPWGTYHDRLATVFAAKGSDFDLLISDSQFVGEFAEGGHIIKLNDWIKEHHGKDINMFDFPPRLVKYFCTYPVWDFDEEKFARGDLQMDKVNYWGLPHEADVMGLVWRADLFRHPDERAAFKAKYGYDLPQTYDDWMNWVTWLHFKDFAEFFTRKAGEKLAGEVLTEDFYGCTTWNAKYDSSPYQFHSYLWDMGGDIWSGPPGFKASGYINSELAVEAAEWYASLRPFEPPGSESYWFDEAVTAMAQGKVAMSINAVGFIGPIWDPSKSKVAAGAECTVWPGMVRDHGPYADGKYYKITQLVGQPMCVSTYSKYKEEALAFFIYWFEDEQQWKWSDGGGGVAALHIINTDRFINAAPWNRAVKDTIGIQKDFWNVPVYNELMLTEGETLNLIYAGEVKNIKAALDALAARHDEIIKSWAEASPYAKAAGYTG
ncbi:MAG: extracellular solute-binding protein [Candidatus Bathyarchaeia archaeon]|nr:extracellular solute-binding protein [Candidatus Bathyarchaeota archaeon]